MSIDLMVERLLERDDLSPEIHSFLTASFRNENLTLHEATTIELLYHTYVATHIPSPFQD